MERSAAQGPGAAGTAAKGRCLLAAAPQASCASSMDAEQKVTRWPIRADRSPSGAL